MTKKSSGWWRPDPGAGTPVCVAQDEVGTSGGVVGTLLLQASVVALSDAAVQLAVIRPVQYRSVLTLAVFRLDTGRQVAPLASVPASWRIATGWLAVIRQIVTGQCCGNCGSSPKCLRLACDSWRPMSKRERAWRALPGPLESLESGWERWTGAREKP